MSRENFFIKLMAVPEKVQGKDLPAIQVQVNISHIEIMEAVEKGTKLSLSSGGSITVLEKPADIERHCQVYGVMKLMGGQ